MDQEDIDIALLYPTLGICWEGAVQDAKLALAYTRAYNRWLVEHVLAGDGRGAA